MDSSAIQNKKLLLIAHRGGVVTDKNPENSEAAIRKAYAQGYRMVELDIRETADRRPVLLHRFGPLPQTTTMDFTMEEVLQHNHPGTDEPILSFQQGLDLCKELQLGIMLDIKHPKDQLPSEEFLHYLSDRINTIDFQPPLLCLSQEKTIQSAMPPKVVLRLAAEELTAIRIGKNALSGKGFWFGNPRKVDEVLINLLKKHEIEIIPTITTYRYPKKNHLQRAQEDVQRLVKLGITTFLIDDIYFKFF